MKYKVSLQLPSGEVLASKICLSRNACFRYEQDMRAKFGFYSIKQPHVIKTEYIYY